ncbi:BQ5605_C009g05475 [Microbotryum silenes-dioicae]|uniref:BQ5605_C009g05475 protein n=1 Tax=Microbotryum silenes-dioicae TaxID=796604 RepID=A0A2X0P8K6_9BASI|nr:BQ5605_C009g05475 [Microbotryum silenes-dioicae]
MRDTDLYLEALRGKHTLELSWQRCSHVHDEIAQVFTSASYYAILSLLCPVSIDLHPPKHHRPSFVAHRARCAPQPFPITASCRSRRYRCYPNRVDDPT